MEGQKNTTLNKTPPQYLSSIRKFFKNPLSVGGLTIIILFTIIALLGYLICPDKSPSANTQILELAGEKPGFSVQVLRVRSFDSQENRGIFTTLIKGRNPVFEDIPFLSYSFMEDKIILREYTDFPDKEEDYKIFAIPKLLYNLDSSAGIIYYNKTDSVSFRLKSGEKIFISLEKLRGRILNESILKKRYILGTDRFGRDLLSRLILGSRISLMVGFVAVIISLFIGIGLGSIAGYYRGWIDNVIMWFINIIWSVPTLLLVIALTIVLGKGFWQVFVAIGITMWTEVARLVRGQVLSLREKEFIEAARVLGYSDLRILINHIIPNILAPVIIISAANFASAILIEAGLSFLGIGVQPPIPSWGGMVKEHYGYILANKAYLAFVPGFAIMLIVLAFTSVGNGLRDAWDVKRDQGR